MTSSTVILILFIYVASNSLILALYNSMTFAYDLFHQVDAVQLPLPCSVRRPDQFPCLRNCVLCFNHVVLLSSLSCICHLSRMILMLPLGYAFFCVFIFFSFFAKCSQLAKVSFSSASSALIRSLHAARSLITSRYSSSTSITADSSRGMAFTAVAPSSASTILSAILFGTWSLCSSRFISAVISEIICSQFIIKPPYPILKQTGRAIILLLVK